MKKEETLRSCYFKHRVVQDTFCLLSLLHLCHRIGWAFFQYLSMSLTLAINGQCMLKTNELVLITHWKTLLCRRIGRNTYLIISSVTTLINADYWLLPLIIMDQMTCHCAFEKADSGFCQVSIFFICWPKLSVPHFNNAFSIHCQEL